MSALSDQLKAINKANAGSPKGRPAPKATSLLAGQLKRINESGNAAAMGAARQAAHGGGGPLVSLGHALSLVQAPLRAVVATGEEVGERVLGRPDKVSWLEHVKDPRYGFGHVIERAAPDLPWIVKSGLGLVGDIALDPLTYATFGASHAVKVAGKSEGLLRFVGEAGNWASKAADAEKIVGNADKAEKALESVGRLKRIGETISKTGTLPREDLAFLEESSKAMAEVPHADLAKVFGKEGPITLTAPDPDLGRFGIHWHVPFKKGAEVTLPGTEGIGRALEGAGYKVTGKLAEKFPKLGGAAAEATRMIHSGDYEQAVGGAWAKAGTRQGRAAATEMMERAGEATGSAVRALQDAGVDKDELWYALGERPLTTEKIAKATKGMSEEEVMTFLDNPAIHEGGEKWKAMVAKHGPGVEEAATTVGKFYDRVPSLSEDVAAHGTSRRAVIPDAAESGRYSYVPRVAHDEFLAAHGGGQAVRPKPGSMSWFQKAGHSVGDIIGEETANPTRLVEPSTVTERYATGAPGLETQIDDAVERAYGAEAKQWYDTDFYKAHDKYIASVAKQTGDQRVQNYLLSKGVSRPDLASSLYDSGQILQKTGRFSGWREDLFGKFDPVSGSRMSYSGKVLNDTEYKRLQVIMDGGDPLVMAEARQWETLPGEAAKEADQRINRILDDMERVSQSPTGVHHVELANLREQKRLWEEARDLLQQAAEKDPNGPEYPRMLLAASRARIQATITGHEQTWSHMIKDTHFIDRMVDVLSSGWEGYGFARQAPSEVVGVLHDIAKNFDPMSGEGLRKYVGIYDHINNWLKGWLTTSLGFIDRNIFGGQFNNWLAGADVIKSTKGWFPVLMAQGGEKATGAQRALYQAAEEMGFLGSGMYSAEFGRVAEGEGAARGLFDIGRPGQASREWSINPLAGIAGGKRAPLPPYMIRRLNEQIAEPLLRGSLYFDRVTKAVAAGRFRSIGVETLEDLNDPAKAAQFITHMRSSGLSDEILFDIAKYHFDYEDLSKFERQVGRRVIPFYTWTRKNVPLQIEAMFTQPGKALGRYAAVKRNLESASPAEEVVPSWFEGQGLMRLPIKFGGNQVYGGIDLPFKDPFEAADVTGFGAGMLSPLIKAPLEAWAGHQFFGHLPLRGAGETGGLQPIPATWKPLIPLFKLADKLPFSPIHAPTQAKGGQWLMAEEDQYLVGQYLPFLAQTQRLLPDQGKYKNRLATTYLSYLFGVQARTNTPQDMENEIFKRGGDVTAILNKLKAQGYVKPKTKPRKQSTGPPLTDVLASLDTATQ